jgi:aryl-alcohol dehydrogenase-like predicted oxidoreductase
MGCWAIGGPFYEGEDDLGWGIVDDQESIRAIHCGLDLGVNFIDTADVYGAGHSETVIAQALQGHRQQVVLATKFGLKFDEQSKQVLGTDASTAYIRRACESSLRRLNTDYIDLYQFHLNDFPAEEAAEVLETLDDLVSQGKIRSFGWSTDFRDRAETFARHDKCTAIQHQINVIDDSSEVLEVCAKNNLASINRGPLAMGLLTGKYDLTSSVSGQDVRGKNSPAWMQYFKDGKPNAFWLNKLDSVREILTSGGRSLPQGALAWLWGRSERTIPIPGFRNERQITENAGAMEFGALSQDQIREIDRLLERE